MPDWRVYRLDELLREIGRQPRDPWLVREIEIRVQEMEDRIRSLEYENARLSGQVRDLEDVL